MLLHNWNSWWVPTVELIVLFLSRFSSNKDHLEAADLYFANAPMKRGLRANNMAANAVKRGSLHHGSSM